MATLSNSNNDIVINGTDEKDYIFSSGVNVQIYGNESDETIENRGYDVTIEAGAGNDSVWTDVLSDYGSSSYRSATVNGGEGDDTLQVRDHQTSLNGGAGNDLISVYSSNWENNTQKLSGDPTAGLITPLGSAAIGLSTNVINAFAGGLNKDVISSIISNGAEIFTESLKLLGESTVLKDTSFGTWITGKTAGTRVETFVNRIFGQTVETFTNHIGNTVSAFLGLYSAINTCLDSIDKYSIAELPDSVTAINTAIDVIGDGIHSFSNAFISVSTAGILDADMIFNGVYAIGAMIKYDLQSIWALATGGDVSQIRFQTESRNFTEIIGDALKSLITGTTETDEIYIVKNETKKHALGGNKKVHNFGSRCTITTDSGKDLIFNHEGTQSNYIDAGNDNDTVVAHGSNNTVKGGQGTDQIALYSDGKSPAGGNVLDGGTGSDAILIDDSKYPTTTRRSNNTINGGEGDDLIGLDNTNIPVVIRYTVGDGNDYIFGYDSNDTIQIVNSSYTTSRSGNDIKIAVGSGVMTLMGANGKTLNVEKISDNTLPQGVSYDKNRITLTVNTKFSGEQIDLANFASTVKKVNASSLVNAVNITGNAADNSIKGGKGSDTITAVLVRIRSAVRVMTR